MTFCVNWASVNRVLMPDKPKYIEQLERVKRWYSRFKEISEGREHIPFADFYQDDIFAFFQNCYHLKDWIKNDPSVAHMKDLVEPFINQSEVLSICADLCNGLKHLTLDRSRSGQDPQFGPKVQKLELGSGPPRISIGYLIVTNSKKY